MRASLFYVGSKWSRRPAFGAVVLLCALFVQDASGAQRAGTTPIFEFHSGFWVNLHHFLYREGRIRRLAKQSLALADAGGTEVPAALDGLTAEQQQAWNAAVDAYAADWSSRDLLLNGDMQIANDRLGELENCAEIGERARPECRADLRKDLMAALSEAAPVYRARWWPDQDRKNRAWIDGVAPLVRRMGTSLAAQLAMVYQRDWPGAPIRVDVVWTAAPLGAYTTLTPVHVTVASNDPRNQGAASLEVLFDEASQALSAAVSQAIARQCREQGKPIPRELWPALSDYTTGEVLRRISAGAPPQEASGASPGLYEGDWSQYRQILQIYWQPYLDGKVKFDTAIARMVAAL